MESNAITFYKKFPVLSVIMPYYDYTHSCFLLLSELCKGSRATLTQWYKEFAIIMKKCWQTFYWGKDYEGEYPPWDLYKLDFGFDVRLNYDWFLNILFSLYYLLGFILMKVYENEGWFLQFSLEFLYYLSYKMIQNQIIFYSFNNQFKIIFLLKIKFD